MTANETTINQKTTIKIEQSEKRQSTSDARIIAKNDSRRYDDNIWNNSDSEDCKSLQEIRKWQWSLRQPLKFKKKTKTKKRRQSESHKTNNKRQIVKKRQ